VDWSTNVIFLAWFRVVQEQKVQWSNITLKCAGYLALVDPTKTIYPHAADFALIILFLEL
jgi:hypothetical protein